MAKRLRLAALADAPDAFLSRLEDERAMPEAAWRERIASNAEGIRTVGFFAVVDGKEQGLAVGVFHAGDPPWAELVSMWVAPPARGRGAGGRLVEAVCAWAAERGCVEVTLSVTESRAHALALYRACGFEETGGRRPFDPEPALSTIMMRRSIGKRTG